uniref:Uncharacterized protein n=1 Tax=Romanomermis culicivorax TaxID=13658 RepID=A0A915JMG6_ROMCU
MPDVAICKNLISFLTQKLRNEKRASVYYSNVPNCINRNTFLGDVIHAHVMMMEKTLKLASFMEK